MRLRFLSLVLAIAFAVAIAACSGDSERTPEEDPQATGTQRPTEDPSAPGSCPDQETVVADAKLQKGGELRGDLDGDLAPETVTLAVEPSGEPGCQAFVVVTSTDGMSSTPILARNIPFEMGFPRLISLPPIDDRDGSEILVGVLAGASTQAAAVFTVDGEQVEQVERTDALSPEENLLAFGGSVGHQSAFDCAPEVSEGAIVVSSAEPVGGGARFSYLRRFYLPEEPGVYAEEESLRQEGTIRFDRFDKLHEFPNAPFGSCPPPGSR